MIMGTKCRISVLVALLGAMMLVGETGAKADSPSRGAGGHSIVNNGGFEDWQAAPDNLRKAMDCTHVPTAWSVQAGEDQKSCSLRRDAGNKHGGRFSVRLGNINTKSGLAIAQRIDAEPEYRYVIRVWFKGDHIDAYHPKGVIVHIVASSQRDKHDTGLWSGVLRAADKTAPPINGTFDWHDLACAFDTPPDTRSIMLLVELRGAGVVWLDDIQVSRLEKCKEVESY
jgi:hypothetical protein